MKAPKSFSFSCRYLWISAAATAFIVVSLPASAANVNWDITPGTVGAGDSAITGGAGTWDATTIGNWTVDAGVTNVLWNNANNDLAIFGAPGGIVTQTEAITANGMTFNSTGYSVTGGTITLAGTTPTISVTTLGDTATLNSILTGSAGFTKAGTGILVLGADNTYTGGTTVSTGTLRLTNSNQLEGATSVATGATLEFNPTTTTNSLTNALTGTGTIKVNMVEGAAGGLTMNAINGFTGTIQLAAATTTGDKFQANGQNTAANIVVGNNTQIYSSTAATTIGSLSLVGTGNNENLGALRMESTLNVTNGTTLQGNTTIGTGNGTLGGTVRGTATTGNTQTLTLGTSNATATNSGTFSGAISDGLNGGKLALFVGPVNMRDVSLNGANTYSGGTTVNFGRVNVGANNFALGTGAVTVVGDGIVGDGQVYVAGATLGNNFTISGLGGNISDTVQRGAIRLDSGSTLNGTVTLAANAGIGANSGVGTINGVISGGFTLTKVDGANIVLRAANTYTGVTTIGQGTVTVSTIGNTGVSGNLGTNGTINIGAGGNAGTLNYTGAGETLNRVINWNGTTGGGFINNNGSGLLTFSANTTTTGSGAKGIFFGGTGDGRIDGTITNLGGILNVAKNGGGTWTFSNTVTQGGGGTTVTAGTLNLAFGVVASNIFSSTSALTLSGGTLKLTGTGTQTFNGLTLTTNTSSGIVLSSANETLTLGALNIGAGAAVNFNTAAGGADAVTATLGTALVKVTGQTPGNVINNNLTVTDTTGFGLATTDASGNVIRLTTATLLPATGSTSATNYRIDNNSGGIAADGSSSLTVTASQSAASITMDTTTASGILTLDLGVTLSSNIWNFSGIGSNTYQITGGTGLTSVASGNAIAFNNYNAGLVTIASPIIANGTNAISFNGNGTTLLNGANTYTGATTITGGTVRLGSATALGTTAAGTTVSAGATLDLNGQTVGAEALTINGKGPTGAGALINNSVTAASLSGAITLASDSTLGGTGNTTLTGALSGGFTLTKTGTGIVSLNVNNTYTGGTVVNQGTLSLGGGGATGTIRGDVTVNSGATLRSTTGDSLGYSLGLQVTNLYLDGGTFNSTVASNQGYTTNFTFTGATSTGGFLNFTNGYGITSLASSTVSTISSAVVIRDTNNMPVNVAQGSVIGGIDMTISGVISGNALTKNGVGTLRLSTNNTYTAGTTVNAGILDLGGGGGASGTIRGTATVNTGATLRLSVNDATGYGGGATALTAINLNGGALNVNTTANQTLGSAVVNMTGGSITGIAGSNIDFFGGASALNTLASSTTSTISGTTISALRQGNTTFSVASGTTVSGIDLDIQSVVQNGLNGALANAVLTKAGAGTLALSGTNTIGGGGQTWLISGGTLMVGNGGSTGTLANMNVTNNARLAFNRSDTAGNFSNVISGTGVVDHIGTGRTILTSANLYSGGTTISAGILLVSNNTGSATGTGAVGISSGGTLAGAGSVAGAVTAATGGTISPGNATRATLTTGALTLAGTYACDINGAATDVIAVNGNLNVTGGTLAIASTSPSGSYVVATYTGSLTGTFATVTGLPSGYGVNYNTTAKQIEVAPITDPFPAWAALKGLTSGNNGKGDNPDGDGLNNLGEFAFDDSPLSGTASGKIVSKVATIGSDQVMTLTIPVRNGPPIASFAAAGTTQTATVDQVIYTVEGSNSLSGFSISVAEIIGTDATTLQSSLSLPSLTTGWTYHSFRLVPTVASTPKGFLRVKVTAVP